MAAAGMETAFDPAEPEEGGAKMSGIRDITPAEPLWPKRRIEKVRRDDEGRPPPEGKRKPAPREDEEGRTGEDHIDEYA